MTATTLSPFRRRLRQRAQAHRPPALPYTHHWLRSGDGLWTLVVRITATGQQLRVSYRVAEQPSDADGARIAARLYGLARGEGA